MIIDLILDRKDGVPYDPRKFYYEILGYENTFNFDFSISETLDYGSELDVKNTLKKYIKTQGYNEDINQYIDSVNWLK